MVFLRLIGVAARLQIHVMWEEAIVITTLIALEVLDVEPIIAWEIFHQPVVAGRALLIVVKVIEERFEPFLIYLYLSLIFYIIFITFTFLIILQVQQLQQLLRHLLHRRYRQQTVQPYNPQQPDHPPPPVSAFDRYIKSIIQSKWKSKWRWILRNIKDELRTLPGHSP